MTVLPRLRLAQALLLCALITHAQTPLETARAALEDGLYTLAEEKATAVLKDPVARLNFADRTRALDYLLRSQAARTLYPQMLATLEQYNNAVPAGSEGAAFLYWKGLALLNLGKPDAVLALQPPPGASPAILSRLATLKGQASLAMGQTSAALGFFKAADATATSRVRIAENALDWAKALTNASARLAVLDAVIDRLPDNGRDAIPPALSQLPLLKADTLFSLGKTNEAIELCRALATHPRLDRRVRQDAYFRLAKLLPDQAESQAEAALKVAQTRGERLRAGFFLGRLLIASTNTLSRGVSVLKEAIAQAPAHPENPNAQASLATALLRAGRYEEAVKEFRICLEAYPESPFAKEALVGRAEAALALGDASSAAEAFARAVRLETNAQHRADLVFRQADSLRAAKRPELAAKLYGSLAPNPKAMLLEAVCLLDSGQSEKAEQLLAGLCAQAGAPVETRAQASLRLAAIFLGRNNFAEASTLFSQVAKDLRMLPRDRAAAWLGLGQVDYQLYRFESACEAFRSAARLDQSLAYRTDFCLVLALYGKGDDAEARAVAGNYLLRHPESPLLPEMALWLAKFDFNRGNYSAARKAFAHFAERWPDHAWRPEALLWSAQAAVRERDYTGTIAILTDLIKSAPTFARIPEARFLQAECLIELARQPEAILLLEEIISRTPDSDWAPKAQVLKADCLLSLAADNPQRCRQALEAYLEALKTAPANRQFEINCKAARCLEKLNRPREAFDRYYEQVITAYLSSRATDSLKASTEAEVWVLKATYQAAEILRRSGQIEEALNILRRVKKAELADTTTLDRWIEQYKALR